MFREAGFRLSAVRQLWILHEPFAEVWARIGHRDMLVLPSGPSPEGRSWMASGFLFRLERADGTPADPPTLNAAVPNWPDGSTIHLGPRTLQVIGRRDDDTDQPPVLVVGGVLSWRRRRRTADHPGDRRPLRGHRCYHRKTRTVYPGGGKSGDHYIGRLKIS